MLVPENNEKQPFTWAKLKEFCNKLTDEQLEQEVIVPQDESNITIAYASELGDDQYYFIDQEYTCTKEDFDPDAFDEQYQTVEEAFEHEDATIIPGSSVYLFEDL